MPDDLYLGVDGGGSHTVALLADGAGRPVGRGRGGPANLHAVGEQAAKSALRAAIDGALAGAGRPRPAVAAACLGLAGVGRAPERELFRSWAAREGLAGRVLVAVDCDLVLAAGTPQGWGLALIAGTGSIAWGRGQGGAPARSGGWGHLLGDEGSGYALGLAALQAVARAADGRGPQTRLTSAILGQWQLAGPEELIRRVYGSPAPRPEIAALAPLVEAAAAEGDAVAREIAWAAGEALGLLLDAAARRLGLGAAAVPCALAGGLLVHGQLVARRALEAAAALGWRLEPVARVEEPALGALRLARGEIALQYEGGA